MTAVRVIRSARRRKTVEARMADGVLEVLVPARLSRAEEERHVAEMVARFGRRRDTEAIDVERRARQLARRYGLPAPTTVRWVDNQQRRWGSCTVETRTIRISSALAGYPSWVLDYVLVHELAHLVEPSHDAAFHELVARYPRAERAEGFLIAKGLGDDPLPARDHPGDDPGNHCGHDPGDHDPGDDRGDRRGDRRGDHQAGPAVEHGQAPAQGSLF